MFLLIADPVQAWKEIRYREHPEEGNYMLEEIITIETKNDIVWKSREEKSPRSHSVSERGENKRKINFD